MSISEAFLIQFGNHPLVERVRTQRSIINKLQISLSIEEKRLRDMAIEIDRLKKENNELRSKL